MTDQQLPTIKLLPGQRLYVEDPSGESVSVYRPKGKGYTRLTASGTWADPDPEPEPEPEPEPTPSGHILGVDISKLPTSGAAWSPLKSWADKSTLPDLRDQNNQGDIVALAKGLVFARTGEAVYRTACRDLLIAAQRSAGPGVTTGDTLGMVRGMGAIALAAILVDYREATFAKWMRDMLTWPNPDRGYTIRSTQEKRPNNWGDHAGASRMAMALYLDDRLELGEAAEVFLGFLGDSTAYTGFIWGDDMSWHLDPSKPVGVNPLGASKDGLNIDGVMPDDMRRGGSFPTVGDLGKNYTWEGLQGVLLQAVLLKAAGYHVTDWSDHAVGRAYSAALRLAGNPSGDDTWQPYAMKFLYGTSASGSTSPGKGFGFTDWLYG